MFCEQIGSLLVGVFGLRFCLPLLCQVNFHFSISFAASRDMLSFPAVVSKPLLVLPDHFSWSSEQAEINSRVQFHLLNQKLQLQLEKKAAKSQDMFIAFYS